MVRGAKAFLAATLVVTAMVGGGTRAAAIVPEACMDGLVALMQQTTMDLDSTYRLHTATLEELRATFGDREGAATLLSRAESDLLGVQLATLQAVVDAANAYEPPVSASAPVPAPTLTYTAVGSTTYSVHAPVRAVDGDDGTMWSSTNPVRDNWLMVDLGAAYEIDRFRMLQATHPDWKAWSYTLASADAPTGPWTARHTYASSAPTDSGVVAFAGGAATARYWRVYANTGGGNGWQVYTFELFARAVVAEPTVDVETCLDGLVVQMDALVDAAGAGMDAVLADLRLALASLPTGGSPTPVVAPTNADQCRDGVWQTSGLGFASQGDCVAWVVTGGRNLAGNGKSK